MEQRKSNVTTKSSSHVALIIIATCLLIVIATSLLITGTYATLSMINESNSSTTNLSIRMVSNKRMIGLPQVSVQTTSGLLMGTKQSLNNIKNSSIYKFLAVPYAEAPVDELRFKRPVELKQKRAESVVDATKFGKTCPQFRHLTRFISPLLNIDNEHQISEDCLHLNVFVPTFIGNLDTSASNLLEPTKQLPVIVWIPGEGFDFADARQFDASYLAHKTQSIVVTVQYRVGIFGFLKAPKLGAQGNMGLYDQIMALKWIKKNIDNFGGDSTRVSVMGRFSGSMSISALITAPKKELLQNDEGQALFSRAIMLSGIAVNDWIIESEPSKKVSEVERDAISRNLCTEEQANNGDCLRNMQAENLVAMAGYGWRLVVDNELVGTVAPVDAIRYNKFNPELEAVLLGETGQEGTLCLYRHLLMASRNNYAQLIEDARLTVDDVTNIIQDDSYTYFKYNSTSLNPTQAALRSLMDESNYIEDEVEQGSRLRDRYLDACSSYMVKSHSRKFKRNLLARNELDENPMDAIKKPVEVYHYELRYKPTFSLAPEYIKTAAHGDDIPLIFGLIYNQSPKSINEADLSMTRKMMSYIGNFVHGNNPLLAEHSSIDTARRQTSVQGSDQVVSLDEEESNPISQSRESFFIPRRRGWSSLSDIVPIEFTEADLREINRSMAKVRPTQMREVILRSQCVVLPRLR